MEGKGEGTQQRLLCGQYKRHPQTHHVATDTCSSICLFQLPIPPLTLVHALAVSHNTLLLSGYVSHNRGKINLATSLAFNQLLLFGPLSVIAAMLAQPCPLLIAPEFILIYGGVHLFNILSGLGPTIVGLSGVGGIGLL